MDAFTPSPFCGRGCFTGSGVDPHHSVKVSGSEIKEVAGAFQSGGKRHGVITCVPGLIQQLRFHPSLGAEKPDYHMLLLRQAEAQGLIVPKIEALQSEFTG